MVSTPVSTWSQSTFGSLAAGLPSVITKAMHAAHELALKAHLSGEMDRNDTYGHTLKVKMFEVLAHAVEQVPGVVTRKPSGGRFALPVVQETSVALLPLRYSSDRREARENAKINLSDLRRSLLMLGASTTSNEHQLTIDDVWDEDVDSRLREMAELDKQLADFGRVVTVGFGSNPRSGLWGLGWGDLSLSETSGKAVWESWEPLPEFVPAGTDLDRAPQIHPVPEHKSAYFDETDEPDELDIAALTAAEDDATADQTAVRNSTS